MLCAMCHMLRKLAGVAQWYLPAGRQGAEDPAEKFLPD